MLFWLPGSATPIESCIESEEEGKLFKNYNKKKMKTNWKLAKNRPFYKILKVYLNNPFKQLYPKITVDKWAYEK